MATNNISFKVNLRQNKNEATHAYLRYYAEPDSAEPLNLKGFARHIADHGKIATFDIIQLVLNNVVSCMTELLAQGQPVKLDGLGWRTKLHTPSHESFLSLIRRGSFIMHTHKICQSVNLFRHPYIIMKEKKN